MCYTNNESNMVISRVPFFNKFGFIIGARNLNLSFPIKWAHKNGPNTSKSTKNWPNWTEMNQMNRRGHK